MYLQRPILLNKWELGELIELIEDDGWRPLSPTMEEIVEKLRDARSSLDRSEQSREVV